MELGGRIAVVTGAASGIGLALSQHFAAEGMAVVMADVEAAALGRSVDQLRDAGARVTGVECDVSDAAQVEALRERTLAAYGGVHLLCNNAGVAPGRPNLRTRPEIWRWVVGVNLLGVAYGVQAFAPLLVAQGEGHIVNTASDAGLVASGLLGPYHASKYGVVGLSESLYLELRDTGVGVSCLCPELVETRIFESTRNAPAALRLPAPAALPIEQVAQLMGTVAMPAADVAAAVAAAIRAKQFWIITHAVTRERMRQRHADIEAGRNPSDATLIRPERA